MIPKKVASLITSRHHKKQQKIQDKNPTLTAKHHKMKTQTMKKLNCTYSQTKAALDPKRGHGLQLLYEKNAFVNQQMHFHR